MNVHNIKLEDQLSAIISRAIEDEISDIRTAIPCKVKKFDKDKNTVNVDILVKEWIGDKTEAIDTLKEVPIVMYGNKKLYITVPIEEGDEGMLIFNDRSIDEHESGFKEVRDNRTHNISDAVFMPMQVRYKDDLIKKYNTEDLEIRCKCVDDLRLQIKPKKKQIAAGFKKEKDTLKMKLDEVEILTNDEKTKIKVTKEKIELTINDDLKCEIKDDEVIFHEKVTFKKDVTMKKDLSIDKDLLVKGKTTLKDPTTIGGRVQTGD